MAEIQIVFEVETQYGIYRDAFYFPADQVPSDEEIALLKQERVDNWIAVITAPPVEVVEPPVEEAPQNG
jgi:hypothetical protein